MAPTKMRKFKMTIIDTCLEILRLTNDGDILSPQDLKLIENCVNFQSEISELMEVKLYEVLVNAKNGYKKPWLHGIENLTIDHEGYIFWKDAHIEHFNLRWHLFEEAKNQALELEKRCKILELKGLPVNSISVIWRWPQILEHNNQGELTNA